MDQQSTRTLSLQQIIFCLLLLLTSSPVSFADNTAPSTFILASPHQSTYILQKYGAQVSEITNQLTYTNNEISYLSVARATGVASLFFSQSVSEQSVLYWPQKQPAPQAEQQITADTLPSLPRLQSYRYSNPAKKEKSANHT